MSNIKRVVQKRDSELKNSSPSRFNIIGNSREIQEVHELIMLAASSYSTVLITGDTGTGKELVAKAIHANSDIKDGPFIAVNCSALPESLLESELFGHTRGAFTGAIKDKIGRFELADGGTLFLDEIGEISPLIQVKLLRFLQEREFERVGDSVTHKSNVRIIAATNRNLRKLVMTGEFREDFFYRLKVFPIHLPPLRERKPDIAPLVNHFIIKFNALTKKNITGLTRDANIILMDYCWPGNIRELENAIEHAFVTCQSETIDIFDLPIEIRQAEIRLDICKTAMDNIGSHTTAPNTPISQVHRANLSEKDELVELLDRYRGNKSEVARQLGVDRTTIWRKMKRFGLL